MQYFQLHDNSSFERHWLYAISIRRRSHVVRWQCPDCGRLSKYPAGSLDVILEEGSQFPDILRCGAYPLLIVSERVVCAFQAAGVKSFVAFPVGIAGIQESDARAEDAPKYFRVEASGECRVDVVASGGTIVGSCPRCCDVTTKPLLLGPVKLFAGSWDGSDLFRDHVLFPRVVFCTQRLADIILAEKLTNVRLDPQGELLTEESP